MPRTRTRQFETKIRCTGRGEHASRQLAQVTYTAYRDTGGVESASLYMQDGPTDTRSYWENPDAATERAAQHRGLYGDGAGMWFRCPTCRRDVRLSTPDLGAAMVALNDAGQHTLDVSLIR